MSLSSPMTTAGCCLQSGTSRAASSELAEHQARDLRVRTLTSLLAALSPVTNAPSYHEGTALSDISTVQQEFPRNSVADPSQSWLKVLNHVAQLLVREHEIVAVLPKRSGPTANISLLVATDSSSDDVDTDSPDGYLIARNPRFNSPEPYPGNPFSRLVAISSHQDMLEYLDRYRHVSYRHHVLGIEVLFNAIIDAYTTYIAVLDDDDSNPAVGAVGDANFNHTTEAVTEAHSCLALRTDLLNAYVTFYSVGKMRRRFYAEPFVKFYTIMTSMWEAQVEVAFEMASRPNQSHQFTKDEMHVFEGLLLDRAVNDYPTLSAALSSARASNTVALHTKDTAWELHRLLLSMLDSARSAVNTLYKMIASPSASSSDLSASLSDVQHTMDRLHFMVHLSPSISAHMKSIESILSYAMDTNLQGGAQRGAFGLAYSHTTDLDPDDGVTDSMIEVSLAREQKRVGEECLWLAVRYQAALESLTSLDSLPTGQVTFTLCEVSAEDIPKTDMHNWKDVMCSIYHPQENSTGPRADNIDISCEEAIKTLEDWATSEGNDVRATHILRSARHKFYGSWHAEAVLGTLRHVCQYQSDQTMIPHDINLARFKHTFNSIGVSKRCCPVCTKLLRLLAPPSTSGDDTMYGSPSMVISSHRNFYPTALPPYLPKGIALQLLVWLEALVRGIVDGLVVKRRLAVQRSLEGEGGQKKVGRAKSADSKGESPGKKGKRKRANAARMESTGVMRRLGL
ncbi:hypothetical protein EV426DRAFT_622383 [Tirmania nivea]|nr:hypothetical protein EV426DRAFT_622383 [Tirmania nivea]